MNKHYRASLMLILIVSLTVFLAVYWLNMNIGYGIVFLVITVGYTVYRDVKLARSEKEHYQG